MWTLFMVSPLKALQSPPKNALSINVSVLKQPYNGYAGQCKQLHVHMVSANFWKECACARRGSIQKMHDTT